MNKLRHMNLFMRIVEAGSITKAAEKLGLSKSVLSQHLKQLEGELATTLLKRTTRRQSLTPSGERFYAHCVKMHQISEQAWDEVMAQQIEPAGKLTITAPHALMDSLVVPALTKTFLAHPKVRLSLICQDEQLDLMHHDIDLAIRVGRSQDSRYKQRLIGQFYDVLCKAKHHTPDLSAETYIANHWQGTQINHTFYKAGGSSQKLQFMATHITDNIYQTISLISAGFGIGIVPNILLPQYTQLAPVYTDQHLMATDVYTVHPYTSAVPTTVKLAQTAIKTAFDDLMFNIT
ncbi:LysR family transcriptional regulator [Pseudoalteromonas sp. MMG005]|uniref:LysR family transcriptional regulator n=1 Tax=Pseudoalteromonas sp. MMG005 TaxID=2822682 RepID=UPI001B3A36A6|nr:LysR family transcriptional regulator [Pseudoalteromonas sp. MMG005]MBQ4845232.1 LysR family transcriptional regulator [Pseudoalteromonas sp. MMG005]